MLTVILVRQIAIMALLIAVGFCLDRKGFLSVQGAKDLGAVLLRVVIPCVIIKSCLQEYSQQRLADLAVSAALALIGFILAMGIAWLAYGNRRRIENFSAAFCNAGFIGIPLVQAVIGEEGVFYVAASIALLNLFQWTYGVWVMTGQKDAISPKSVAKNPVVIAILIGFLLFALQIPVPEVVESTLGYIAAMNTPVAMLLMGTYLAKLSPKQLLDRSVYGCVFLRLLVIPAATLLVFFLLPVSQPQLLTAVLLAAATPVGANICIFAQQYDCDYQRSVVTVCLSTILSVVTIPLLFSVMQHLL